VYVSDFSTVREDVVDCVESETFFDFGIGGNEEVKEGNGTEKQECGEKGQAA
jgi:hypothetical protein